MPGESKLAVDSLPGGTALLFSGHGFAGEGGYGGDEEGNESQEGSPDETGWFDSEVEVEVVEISLHCSPKTRRGYLLSL